MSVGKSWDLQKAIYSEVETAVAGESPAVPVHDHTPVNPPNEYIRVDGFNVSGRSRKNDDRGLHSFQVHVFTKSAGVGTTQTRGQARVKALLDTLHTALIALTFEGITLNFEYMEVDEDGDGTGQHGWIRYTITL